MTPAADVGTVLAGAVGWLEGCHDLPLWATLHTLRRGLRPVTVAMGAVGQRVAQHQDAAEWQAERHYAYVL